jgi:hypothetical protein
MMRIYWQCTNLERRVARAAFNSAKPDGEGRIDQAALQWGGFAIGLALGCAVVVAGFVVIVAATTQGARFVGLLIALLLILVWTGRAVWKYAIFRRSLPA